MPNPTACPKLKPYRNKALLQAAKDESCVKCGSYEGVSSCHYTGFRQALYGKGRGIKCSDLMSAYLCMECHRYYDEYLSVENTTIEESALVSEDFLHCIALTNIRRLEQGVLK